MHRFPVPGDVIKILPEWEEYIVTTIDQVMGNINLIPRDGPYTDFSEITKNIPDNLDLKRDIVFLCQVKVKYNHRNRTYTVKGDT